MKMSMNQKGLTVIELMAVLVIFGVIITITYPNILDIVFQVDRQYYANLEKSIEFSAIDFSADNPSFLPKMIGGYKRITLEQILKYSEMDAITDRNGNPCQDGYVVIHKKGNDSYQYTPCFTCGSFKTNNKECKQNDSKYTVDYVLRHKDKNGQSYLEGTWSSTNIYQEFFHNQLYGVRVDVYQKSIDGSDWEDFEGNSFVLEESHNVSVRAIDIDGNISEPTEVYRVRIDKNPIVLVSKNPVNDFLWRSADYQNTKISDLFVMGSFGPSGGKIECKIENQIVYLNDNGKVSIDRFIREFGLTRRSNIHCSAITGAHIQTEAQTQVVITAPSTVTFQANGGVVSPTTKSVIYQEPYGTLPIPTRSGYTFEGWFTEISGGIKITESTIVSQTTNQTLYARWKANHYVVTLHGNGGSPSVQTKNVTYHQNYGAFPTVHRVGYQFLGWFTSIVGGVQVTSDTKVDVAQNQTLYAHWKRISFTVTFHANGGVVSPSSKVVNYAETYGVLPTPIKSDYTFLGWYTSLVGGVKISEDTLVSLTSNQTLYARYSHTILLVGNENQLVSKSYVFEANKTYTVMMAGGAGGADTYLGGGGGYQTFTVRASSDTTVTLYAGGRGEWNNAGRPDGQIGLSSGGGGGSSSIWLGNKLLFAVGGGGGGGQASSGGAGYGNRCNNTSNSYTSFSASYNGRNGQTYYDDRVSNCSSLDYYLSQYGLTDKKTSCTVIENAKADGGGGGGGFPAGTNHYFHASWWLTAIGSGTQGAGDFGGSGGCGYNYYTATASTHYQNLTFTAPYSLNGCNISGGSCVKDPKGKYDGYISIVEN